MSLADLNSTAHFSGCPSIDPFHEFSLRAQKTFDEMELTLDMCSEMCPHCGAVNLMPGFSKILAYTCSECGEPVRLSDGPDVGRFFEEG